MDIRTVINIVESAQTLREGKLVSLSSGKKLIQSPSRSDIKAMLAKDNVLRGAALQLTGDGSSDYTFFVWPAKSLSHATAFSALSNDGFAFNGCFSVKIGASAESIREDRYWKSSTVYDCDGYFVAFYATEQQEKEIISTEPYYRRLFPITQTVSETAPNDSSPVTLLDLYSQDELDDETEAIYHYGDEETARHPFTVKTMAAQQAKNLLTKKGDITVVAAFKRFADADQKAIVKDKIANFDPSRIVVLDGNKVIDGNHHLMAALAKKQNILYIDLAERKGQ